MLTRITSKGKSTYVTADAKASAVVVGRGVPPMVASWEGGVLPLGEGEGLRLGSGDRHNDFGDVSLVGCDGQGFPPMTDDPEEGDILLAMFEDGRVLPGKAIRMGRRLGMELASEPKEGKRAFVLDEDGKRLATVSLASDGSSTLRMLPKISMASWLHSMGSKALAKQSRYSAKSDKDGFVITDRKTGDSYRGALKGVENELGDIEWRVATGGLGAVLSQYKLRRA